MLRQASVSDLIADRVNRGKGYVVITMRRYPRFVRRELRDEYLTSMSPTPELHQKWLTAKRRHASHNQAFERVGYEHEFSPSDEGFADLERLVRLAKRKTVFLVCQCRVGDRCHREMLLVLAREVFDGKAEEPLNEYPDFKRRLGPIKRKLMKASKAA